MLIVECWLDVHNNGSITIDEDASRHLKVEEGDEFVAFIRDERVILVKKKK